MHIYTHVHIPQSAEAERSGSAAVERPIGAQRRTAPRLAASR